MANEGKIAENIANSAANGAVSSNVQNNGKAIPKHKATTNIQIDNDSPSVSNNNNKSFKQTAKELYANYGSGAKNNIDMSPEEEKAYNKERNIKATQDVIDSSADVAASSKHWIPKVAGYTHKTLNAITNNKYGRGVAKVADGVNTLLPGSKGLIRGASESGAAKAVGNALSSKNGGASKAGEKVGEEAEKVAGKTAENVAKSSSKKAAEKTLKSSSEGNASASVEFYKKPLFWLIAGVPVILVLLVIFVILMAEDISEIYGTGEFPYAQMDFSQTIKVKTGNSYSTVDMDDYVAGVLPAEVGEFSSSKDTLKAAAIAARTYALKKMKTQGYVINSTANQVYNSDSKYTKSGNVFYEAAHETAGVVLVTGEEGNYSFMNTEYDALAINESCGGSETADTFTICQKGVQIPVAWAKSHGLTEGALNIYRKAYHGRGMSQWGAFYLASEQKYNYKMILNLFYDNPIIVSLYPPAPKQGEIALEIKVTPDKASQLTHNSVANFLSSKGKNIKSVNDGLRDAVIKAGPGTREGVATAALYLINTFLEYDIRLPYQMGGGWAGNCKFDCRTNRYYGINPKWGSAVDNKSAKYNSLGMDCASFVTWAFHTGGLKYPSGDIKQFGYLSGEHVIYHNVKNTSEYKGQPGDFMYHPGHVMLILGYYSEGNQEGYYIAEASGYQNDIRVIKRSISSLSSTNKIGEMTYHYKNSRVSDYKSAFDKGRLD